MIKVIESADMGRSDHDWLHSRFHFSFADYVDPSRTRFGPLRVLNDDTFHPHGGFPTHPHDNMEILSYVIDGHLTHKDSLGNGNTLGRGDMQYMSAGTGIRHSEFNHDDAESLRFLQIWILPDAQGYAPNYGDYRFPWNDRAGAWLLAASGAKNAAPIRLHQDVNVLVATAKPDEMLYYNLDPARQAYLVQIEGEGMVGGNELAEGDAAEITATREVVVRAKTPSHYILLDLPTGKA